MATVHEDQTCRICGTKVKAPTARKHDDAAAIQCWTCGDYEITPEAYLALHEAYTEQKRYTDDATPDRGKRGMTVGSYLRRPHSSGRQIMGERKKVLEAARRAATEAERAHADRNPSDLYFADWRGAHNAAAAASHEASDKADAELTTIGWGYPPTIAVRERIAGLVGRARRNW